MFGHQRAKETVNYYNLAVAGSTSVNEIAQWTIEAMGLDPKSVRLEYTGGARGWPGDVPQVRLDTRRMEALGWRPKMSSEEAVQRAIRETVEQLRPR
jgi:UDP-glucose 4-epimerase